MEPWVLIPLLHTDNYLLPENDKLHTKNGKFCSEEKKKGYTPSIKRYSFIFTATVSKRFNFQSWHKCVNI